MAQEESAAVGLVGAETSGLTVLSRDGDKLGSIKTFMFDKQSGQAAYVILSLGGFLGLNKSFYPVPFDLVRYEQVDDYYMVTVDRRVLEGGPSWANNPPQFDANYAERVTSYYSSTAAP